MIAAYRRLFLRIAFLGAIAVLYFSAAGSADDAAPAVPTSNPAGLSIVPGSEIVLMPGEQTPLGVADASTGTPIQAGKIVWTIDGQSPNGASSTLGSLDVPQSGSGAGTTIYTAPTQMPAESTMHLKGIVATAAGPVTLTARITIVSDPNWFAFEGDVAPGTPPQVPMQPDPKRPSKAGPFDDPMKLLSGQYMIWVFGTEKGNGNARVRFVLSLGKIDKAQEENFTWISGATPRGLEVDYRKFIYADWGSKGAKPVTLGGYTTLLKPDPKDSSNLVKGFFSGNLVWFELVKLGRPPQINSHYVTIRGHFAVPESK